MVYLLSMVDVGNVSTNTYTDGFHFLHTFCSPSLNSHRLKAHTTTSILAFVHFPYSRRSVLSFTVSQVGDSLTHTNT